ncbi:MAG: hypothetical protein H7A53_12145 [Akkermansiaceae bacterium]|nr:hypothetical protein [Akkermansiaceae bacterium]MCP5551631.1 hypothetical protein [Akkermansiaceae bacterium]
MKSDADPETIVCPVTPWFYRRTGLLAAIFAAMGLYFLYDGAIGYPQANRRADWFEAFEAGKAGGALEAAKAKTDPEFAAAHAAGAGGGSWAAFAAKRGMAETKPRRHTEAEIRGQFGFAALLGIAALGVAGWMLAHRGRAVILRGDEIHWPFRSRTTPLAAIGRVDLSRWDRGVARLEVKVGNGKTVRPRLDDYQYAGTDRILRRLAARRPETIFEGGELGPESGGSEVPKSGDDGNG